MDSLDLYCTTCGAANALGTVTCFACGKNVLQAGPEDNTALLNGRYRILAPVGQGGFAKVYKAEDTLTGEIVAIKAITLKSLAPQEVIDATDTYNREIHFGTILTHISLPKIYDYFMDQEHWYIVVEFIEGQTLEEYMQHHPQKHLPLQEVLSIGIQVCDVLSYLHLCHPPIIFRDVKPDNIMRTADGRIYLIDFGIARRLRPGRQRDTQTLGSPGYAAPEQYGSAQTTECSDIYSLGATLRALLTGKNPLDAPAGGEDLAGHAGMPPEFVLLLLRMLEKDSLKRPVSARAVRQQLVQIAKRIDTIWQGIPQPVLQANPWQAASPPQSPLGRSTKKRPIWPNVLVASLALLIIGMTTGAFGAISSFALHGFLRHTGTFSPGQPQLTKAMADKQVFTYALGNSGSVVLDPTAAIDTTSTQQARLLYAGLVQLDDNMNVQPQLASSWHQSADGLTWIFTLRPNLRFSDGNPLTSADVAYSIDRALDPAVNSPTASTYLQYIADADKRMSGNIATLIGDSILTPDPTTIDIRTTGRSAFLLSTLTCPCVSVVEKSLIDKYGAQFVAHLNEGGSSGPFKFSSQSTTQQVDFVANPYYYGTPPQITKVSFVAYKDSQDAYQAYLLGQATAVDVLQAQSSEFLARSDFHRASQLWINYYAMNYLVKPFDNIAIRQAFALALNKSLIAHSVWHDTVSATNHIIPMGQFGSHPALRGLDGGSSVTGDFGLAKQLLQKGMQEEGISNIAAFPPVTLTYEGNSATIKNEVTLVQQMWKSVLGINVQLQELTFANLLAKESASVNNAHGLQLWRLGYFAGYPDPQDWTTLQFDKGSALNTVNYGQNSGSGAAEQQSVQRMLEQADATPQTSLRTTFYEQAEQELINDVAWLPISQTMQSYLLQTHVVGYKMNAMHVVPADDWAHIYIGQ